MDLLTPALMAYPAWSICPNVLPNETQTKRTHDKLTNGQTKARSSGDRLSNASQTKGLRNRLSSGSYPPPTTGGGGAASPPPAAGVARGAWRAPVGAASVAPHATRVEARERCAHRGRSGSGVGHGGVHVAPPRPKGNPFP